MSSFNFKNNDLEKNVQDLEFFDLPLNFSDLIGEGSAAAVYKSTLKKQVVAIKVFKLQFAKKQVWTVAEQLRKLKHKNIVEFYGFSLRPTALCFEVCSVQIHNNNIYSLRDLLTMFNDNEYLNLTERINYVIQACEGIAYLHESNIIHRDIKPSNMLVSGSLEQITIKVSDFGDMTTLKNTICNNKTISKEYLKEYTGLTLGYIAPEIIKKTKNSLSFWTDIYAMAISSFEIFSNLQFPWEKNFPLANDVILLDALKNDERPYLQTLKDLYKNREIDEISRLLELSWKSIPEERLTLLNLIRGLNTMSSEMFEMDQSGAKIEIKSKMSYSYWSNNTLQ